MQILQLSKTEVSNETPKEQAQSETRTQRIINHRFISYFAIFLLQKEFFDIQHNNCVISI